MTKIGVKYTRDHQRAIRTIKADRSAYVDMSDEKLQILVADALEDGLLTAAKTFERELSFRRNAKKDEQ